MVATPELPITASLAPDLDELYAEQIQELSKVNIPDDQYTLDDLTKMLRWCPINRVAVELKALRAATTFGDYYHSDPNPYPTASGEKTIQEWIRGNFDSMRGSLTDVVGKIVRQAYALGRCCGEIVWEKKTSGIRQEWRLKRINLLTPSRYNFAGSKGKVDRLVYTPNGGKPFAIPYSKVVHVYSPSIDEPDDPRGDPQAARALPFYRARQQMYKAWSIAAKKQATGTTVIQAPSEKTVPARDRAGNQRYNADGSPKTEPALTAAVSAAQQIENGSVFGTDLENRVTSIPANGGENFFNITLIHYQKIIFYCYGVPSTIFDDTASGIGNTGVNAGHRLILDNQIEAIIQSLRDELLEKVVRPLLLANFGRKFESNLGEFKSQKFLDPALASTRVSNLIMAMTNGPIDANDLEAINRLREDLGLSPLPKEIFDQQQIAKLLAQQEQQVNEQY
ncbi:hypothetical protein BZZ01_04745 [Nostocales cyanobacterium HT-58-2]|nr:hypothetical protein BZZ01_04745 [Nostocales cyanobacterium HT-58-2]